MEFDEKNVKRAVRDFDFIILALNVAENKGLYFSRLRSLIAMLQMDCVLSKLIYPYLEIEINNEEIEIGDWFHGVEIHLPANVDLEIAYVLQCAEKLSNDNQQVKHMISNIFSETNETPLKMAAIQDWHNQLLHPTLERLSNKLNDLIEDQVEGKETVTLGDMNIKNK